MSLNYPAFGSYNVSCGEDVLFKFYEDKDNIAVEVDG